MVTLKRISEINIELKKQMKKHPAGWCNLNKAGLKERKKMLKTWIPKDAVELRIINCLAQMSADTKAKRKR